ncbi:helix-turn-helix domain-containing protein [Chitinophaga sp. 30R24]|uniref:helix-turn-helix domain-containing protein n=1 Tax=Chitinophaga sp. 30R24 TaxID=3248838 RepID=UPI003B9214D1
MFSLFEKTHGAINFAQYDSKASLLSPPFYIPGGHAYESMNSFGTFFYQQIEQKHFTIWKSIYIPNENISLRVKRNKKWIGFRLMLKKHITHVANGRLFGIMQGQAIFSYAPITDVEFYLKKDQVYEVVDMQVSPILLQNIKMRSKAFQTLFSAVEQNKHGWVSEKPAWGGYLLLDKMEYLLLDPTKENVAQEIVGQIITALSQNDEYDKKITYDQVENLYKVRELIRSQYNESMSLRQWAKEARMNTTDFKYKFRQIFNVTPYRLLMYERIKAAKDIMLNEPDVPLSVVSVRSGFRTYNNLRRAFYRIENIRLSEWRNLPALILFQCLWDLIPGDVI